MKSLLIFLLLGAAPPATGADEALVPAQRELVEAERDFVRLAAERGFRDSFYEYFAEDGLGFNPHPFRMRPFLALEPSVPGPMGATWAPVYGDVSRAGDLGWNTGPLVFHGQGGQPDRHGMFFSVWKRQADGSWKVVLDVGSGTPTAVVPLDAPFETSHTPGEGPAAPADVAAETDGLLAVEREFLQTARDESVGRAYGSRLADDARVHRPRAMPVVGRAALEWADGQSGRLRGEPLGADVARSGELGYAYGSYETSDEPAAAGYYARVWKKDAGGNWRIVFDTLSPLPAGVRPLGAELQRAEAHFFAGRWSDAEAIYRRHVEANPGDGVAWNRLGSVQLRQERYADAIASFERAVQAGGGTASDFYNLACAHALAGASERALDFIARALAAGLRNRRQYESDPDLATLRELPRFRALMADLE